MTDEIKRAIKHLEIVLDYPIRKENEATIRRRIKAAIELMSREKVGWWKKVVRKCWN